MKNNKFIIYHKDSDGFGCRYLLESIYGEMDSYEFQYGDELPEIKDYDKVFICDVTLSQGILDELELLNDSVHYYDHHPASENLVEHDSLFIHYDPNYCATMIVYMEECMTEDEIDFYLLAIDAYDTWKWKNTEGKDYKNNLKYFANYLNSLKDYDSFKWVIDYNSDQEIINKGYVLYEYEYNNAKLALERGIVVNIKGAEFLVINGNYNLDFYELEIPTKRYIFYRQNGNTFNLSIRGLSGYPVRDRVLATFENGGGHELACGANIDLNMFYKLMNNEL